MFFLWGDLKYLTAEHTQVVSVQFKGKVSVFVFYKLLWVPKVELQEEAGQGESP